MEIRDRRCPRQRRPDLSAIVAFGPCCSSIPLAGRASGRRTFTHREHRAGNDRKRHGAAKHPKELSLEEIAELRRDFANSNRFAFEAGMDGVEIHAAGGFLIDSFLQSSTNHRTDEYGGSLENRFRFLKEVLEDAIEIWGADRVGIKLSPTSPYNDMGNSDDILETFTYVYSQLDSYGLAFLEVNEELPFSEPDPEKRAIVDQLRKLWSGVYIANGNYDAESGNGQIASGKATAISFGRAFIANPDLPRRLKQNGPFNEPNPETFYGGDTRGLTDYPFLDEAMAQRA